MITGELLLDEAHHELLVQHGLPRVQQGRERESVTIRVAIPVALSRLLMLAGVER
jgi:hypothetical protein